MIVRMVFGQAYLGASMGECCGVGWCGGFSYKTPKHQHKCGWQPQCSVWGRRRHSVLGVSIRRGATMIKRAFVVAVVALALAAVCLPGWCGRLEGNITAVGETSVTAEFPARVKAGAVMMVMSGKGEAVAGVAVSQDCKGSGPYQVTGHISWINDTLNFKAGKRVYVNSLNASAIPSEAPTVPNSSNKTPGDLGFYYYSAAQNVGYGAFGLGLEKSLNIGKGLVIEVDGGLTSLGNIDASNGSVIDTESLIKTLNGRLKLDLVTGFALYGGYRWNEGRGTDEKWDRLTQGLQNRSFVAGSDEPIGQVQLRGLEYGIAMHAGDRLGLSLGYIPKLRTDYGGLGVLSEPAYTAELRFGSGRGGVRLRGLTSEDYWSADLGITIR